MSNFSRAEIARVVLYELAIVEARMTESNLAELANAVASARRNDIVVRNMVLRCEPHSLDVILGVSPVAARLQVAEIKFMLQTELDSPDSTSHLARHERFASAGRFVVEEDSVHGVNAVRLAVIHRRPVGVHLRASVRATRVEWRRFALRRRGAAEHLGRTRLVEARMLQPALAQCFEQPDGAERGNLGSVLWDVEADPDVALSTEVIDLVG